ncbi:MAG: phospholipase D-like domain-containing protein, partial [Chlorobiales bacterium]|nr:phospholipase D-like domain-containing protein [Chlorobiales bacterium]
VAISFAFLSAGHAMIRKRDPQSALGWITVCLLLPFLGAILYWQFGVNRMTAVGQQLRRRWPEPDNSDLEDPAITGHWPSQHIGFSRLSRKVTRRRLEIGNDVDLLINGEEAYPAMLDAIRSARESISLCTYIFDSDRVGRDFADELSEAVNRGVDVKVLVDSMGEKYSRPGIAGVLRKKGVPTVLFLPWTLRPLKLYMNLYMNLRNHRKILVVDGKTAFTGGMNIGARHLANADNNPKKALDLHFRVQGPVVADIEHAFLEDWSFATGKSCLRRQPLDLPQVGSLYCRVIIDGPNEDFEKLRWMYMGATNAARESVRVMTPYFVPDRELVASLNAAALRG